MTEETQTPPAGDPPPPPPIGDQPHITQAPQVPPVAFADLRQTVQAERSVFNGTRALVLGIRQRLEEIAGTEAKDTGAVREELRAFVGELNADTWARALVDNTAAKNEPDPQSNRPVPSQINV